MTYDDNQQSKEKPQGLPKNLSDGTSQIIDVLLKNKFLNEKQVDYARRVWTKLETSRTLLDIIKGLKYVTDSQIKEALRKSRVSMHLGSMLVDLGYISEDDLQNALNQQQRDQKKTEIG